jgi:hypothetical protein
LRRRRRRKVFYPRLPLGHERVPDRDEEVEGAAEEAEGRQQAVLSDGLQAENHQEMKNSCDKSQKIVSKRKKVKKHKKLHVLT